MALKNKDFIEAEFTGKVKGGEIFDSNIKEELESLHEGHNHPVEAKPFIFCLGQGMFLKAIDDFLIGKPEPDSKTPVSYDIELSPEKAFGARDSKLIQMIPLKAFRQSDSLPSPGMVFNFDGRIAKILSVSSGRVIVDFNNPLSGKTVIYKIIIKRKVEDLNEKIKSFIEFLFKRNLEFEIKDKTLLLSIDKSMADFAKLFSEKFREIFDLNLEIREIEEKQNLGENSGAQ
jgi:FKBP-type peptidyl-prolyl cis-trans isomerase 2